MVRRSIKSFLDEWAQQKRSLEKVLHVAHHLNGDIERTEGEIAKLLLPEKPGLGETFLFAMQKNGRKAFLEITVLDKGYRILWRN